jgi:hypothetical protein
MREIPLAYGRGNKASSIGIRGQICAAKIVLGRITGVGIPGPANWLLPLD